MKPKTRQLLVRAALSATMLLSIGCAAGPAQSTMPSSPAASAQQTIVAPQRAEAVPEPQPVQTPNAAAADQEPAESASDAAPASRQTQRCNRQSKRAGNCKSPGYDSGLAALPGVDA